MKKYTYLLVLSALILTTSLSCSSKKNGLLSNLNLFTIDQDRELGLQVKQEIESDRATYPIIDSTAATAEVYRYIYSIRDKILNSGQLTHKNDFPWRIRIIKNDSVLNAFCTPGGYIYVYTGILNYLDSEDQFAGVLAHEIAHADLRHSTRQMTKLYGVEALLGVVAGKSETVKQITSGLVGLKFSRDHETEADYHSVKFLCPTTYNAAGGGGFFQKIQNDGSAKTIEFLSTHPNPEDRIAQFNKNKTDMGCTGTQTYQSEFKNMVAKIKNLQATTVATPAPTPAPAPTGGTGTVIIKNPNGGEVKPVGSN